jgi:hypothetical protein
LRGCLSLPLCSKNLGRRDEQKISHLGAVDFVGFILRANRRECE